MAILSFKCYFILNILFILLPIILNLISLWSIVASAHLLYNLNLSIMLRDFKNFKVVPFHLELKLETVSDKTGNIYHCVTFSQQGKIWHYYFAKLSSALDFINSNFK